MKSIFLFVLLAFAASASAHSHQSIDAEADLVFDAKGLVGVQNSWTFDLNYSQAMIAATDKNGNGKFEPEELDVFQKQIVDAAAKFSGYNYVGDGTRFYTPKESRNLRASVNPKGRLVIEFLNVFDIPIIPNDYRMLILVVNDPTNYVQISADLEKSKVRAPKGIDAETFVDSLDDLTQFKGFSSKVKGLYIRFRKTP